MNVAKNEISVLATEQALDWRLDDTQVKPSHGTGLGVPGTWTLYRNWERWLFLAILVLITTSNYFDYYIISVLLEPIKQEFKVSDTQLGLLTGVCFALVYGIAGLPTALWADRGNRRTVLTLAVAGWSLMTALCGISRSFLQLALARFGVGAISPAAIPPAQSLIADYFPPERRAIATTILISWACAAGWVGAVGGGEAIAVTHGWRAAFLLAGIPGLLLAPLAGWVLREPRRESGFSGAQRPPESIRQTFLRLQRKRSFLFVICGLGVFCIFSYGVTVFVPSFMIRSFHATPKQLGEVWVSVMAVANILGAVSGGWIADRLGRDIRWFARIPAIVCIVGAPLYAIAFLAENIWLFIGIQAAAQFVIAAGAPVTFVAISAVCGARRRAIASAIALSIGVLVGGTLGPLLAGAMSDALNATHGADSLRYSLTAMCAFLLPAAGIFYCASHAMPGDKED